MNLINHKSKNPIVKIFFYKKTKSTQRLFIQMIALGCLFNMFYGCANIVALKGGAKDETPPKIVEAASTPNFTTNFKGDEIILTFDEWIKLDDVFNQVVVSPPFNKKEVNLKKKSVIVDLSEEVLKPNVTYTINFGGAVKDITEGNIAQNLRFVFSTGDFIDSLEVEGTVIGIEEGKPVEGVRVMLYENLEDSVIYKERPLYVSTTDKEGHFHIQNIKEGEFKVIALKDENLNYLFENGEHLDFLTTPIVLSDSTHLKLQFIIFGNNAPLFMKKAQSNTYGHVQFIFNQILRDSLNITYTPNESTFPTLIEYEKDTINFWYRDTASSKIFILQNDNFLDTVEVDLLSDKNFYKKNKTLKQQSPTPKKSKLPNGKVVPPPAIVQNPNLPISIVFPRPIDNIDIERILLLEDTSKKVVLPTVNFGKSKQSIEIKYKFKDEKNYQLVFLPEAFKDIYNITNDTIRLKYRTKARKDYGNINVTVDGLESNKAYVIEVATIQDKVIKTFIASNTAIFKATIESADPTKYIIKVIEDANANGQWDTGEYPNKKPEIIFQSQEGAELRANWDLELKLTIGKQEEKSEE